VVGLLWGLTTAARVQVWGDEGAIWAEATRVSPQKPRGWVNLGIARHQRGDVDGAEAAYRQAVRVAWSRPPDEQRIARGLALVNWGLLRIETDLPSGMRMIQAARLSRVREVEQVARWFD